MAKKPYKYVIPVNDEETTIDLQGKILYFACRNPRKVELWAEYDPDRYVDSHTFRVITTGHDVPIGTKHANTVISINDPSVVLHVYEVE